VRTPEQRAAFKLMRDLAAPFRFRVVHDAEQWPTIPAKFGVIEFFCFGDDCHSCPTPGEFELAAWTDRRRLISKLAAVPNATRWQIGQHEARFIFPPEALAEVAAIVRAKRRSGGGPGRVQNLRHTPASPRKS
jgi:hypothetical protein